MAPECQMLPGGRSEGRGGLKRKEWRRLVSLYRVRSIAAAAKSQMLNNLPLEAEARRKTLRGCFTVGEGAASCDGERSRANKQTHCARTQRVTRHGVLLRGDKVARGDNPPCAGAPACSAPVCVHVCMSCESLIAFK